MLSSILDSKRVEQICKPNGWRKPDHVDIQCKRDGKFTKVRSREFFWTSVWLQDEVYLKISQVNEIAAELENLKTSLVNNKLLHSCTIQGATNDWYQVSDDTVAVEGIFWYLLYFENVCLVDVSNLATKITKIDRINTSLTCTRNGGTGCPSANGSNNIKRKPDEDFKFWVYLRKDGTQEPPFSVKDVQNFNFVIHYEVEGPCA